MVKTTLDLPDDLYRQIKAVAALQGRSVKELCTEALREKLQREQGEPTPAGWRVAFGAVSAAAVREVQGVIDEELSTIDPADWR